MQIEIDLFSPMVQKEIYLGSTPKFLAAHRFYEKNDFREITKDDLPHAFPMMKVDTKFYKFKL